MRKIALRERKVDRAVRPPPPWSPPIPMFREFPYWRRTKRILVEHWIAAAILLLAFANAARLLGAG